MPHSNTPPEMMTNGRPALPFLDSDEKLYRRVPPYKNMFRRGRFTEAAFELPDISVNRSSICKEPEWVRIDFPNFAVAYLKKDDCIFSNIHSGSQMIEIMLDHTPKKKNYSHSDIQAHCDGDHIKNLDAFDPEACLRIRQRLAVQSKMQLDYPIND